MRYAHHSQGLYQEAINPFVEVVMYGQELNNVSYAIAKSDVLIMDENAENILLGNYFAQDKIKGLRFTYMLSNPPVSYTHLTLPTILLV